MTDTPFEIRSGRRGKAVVIEVVGEIDMATAPELAKAIGPLRDGADRVVADLSGVDFIDSSALNALLQCRRELAVHGIPFRVVSPPEHVVRRVFEITSLIDELGVVASVDDALAS